MTGRVAADFISRKRNGIKLRFREVVRARINVAAVDVVRSFHPVSFLNRE